MSHELRTPLNVITGYAEILCDPDLGTLGDDHATAARGIRRSAAELFELVTKTLDLSRLELGVDALRLERVALREVYAEVEAELASLMRPNEVRVSYAESGAAPIEVVSDRGKLKTILKNLLANALKFTAAGEVAVRASSDGEHLVIHVRDTGIGIPVADRGAIFEMFRQLAPSNSAGPGGVGLGLYIVKRLIDLLGGSIAVASTPGVGSEFTLVLPARALDLRVEERSRDADEPRVAAVPAGATSESEAASAPAPARRGTRAALVRSRRPGYKRGP
jgi:signal transduction histidine kinase